MDDPKSTSGNCFSLGSGVTAWSSKKQETIALSPMKAEYITDAKASAQVLWIRKVLEDIGEMQNHPTKIL